jgi:hypothetical protein
MSGCSCPRFVLSLLQLLQFGFMVEFVVVVWIRIKL